MNIYYQNSVHFIKPWSHQLGSHKYIQELQEYYPKSGFTRHFKEEQGLAGKTIPL